MSEERVGTGLRGIDYGPENILVVDDEPAVRRYLQRALAAQGWTVQAAGSAEEALRVLEKGGYALVLADVRMPGKTGLWLLERIIESYPDMHVVMVTGDVDVQTARTSLTRGATDYISKPVNEDELEEVVKRSLAGRRLLIENRAYRENLEKMVKERTGQLEETVGELREANAQVERAYRESIYRLAAAAEYRDEETGNHIRRLGAYSYHVARGMECDKDFLALILVASPMHDVGKIGIPDAILLKPGKLNSAEFTEIKKHTTIGARILSGSSSPLMQMAESIALNHHEKFNGSGYPGGLVGEDIPLEGRIVAIADVFDALTSTRVYKPAYSVEKSVAIMEEEMKGSFDPQVWTAFNAVLDDILEASRQYADEEAKNGVDGPVPVSLETAVSLDAQDRNTK